LTLACASYNVSHTLAGLSQYVVNERRKKINEIRTEVQNMDVKLAGEVYVWVTKPARPRSLYSGRGESRVVTGREQDGYGAPLSGVEAVAVSDSLGVTPGATAVMPDSLAADLPIGAVVAVSGRDGLSARIVGGDFGSTRVSIHGITDARVIADGPQLMRDAAGKQSAAARTGTGTPGPTGRVSA
jgi:hypothetical protein